MCKFFHLFYTYTNLSIYSNYVTKMDTHPRSAPQIIDNGQRKKEGENDEQKQGMTNAGTVAYI